MLVLFSKREIIDGDYLFEKQWFRYGTFIPRETSGENKRETNIQFSTTIILLLRRTRRCFHRSLLWKRTYSSVKEPSSFGYALVDSFHTYSPSLPLIVKGEFCVDFKRFWEGGQFLEQKVAMYEMRRANIKKQNNLNFPIESGEEKE